MQVTWEQRPPTTEKFQPCREPKLRPTHVIARASNSMALHTKAHESSSPFQTARKAPGLESGRSKKPTDRPSFIYVPCVWPDGKAPP